MLMCPTACAMRAADSRLLRWPSGVAGRDAGMSTAEYAVATLAACAFATVLYQVVTSSPVTAAMHGLIERAFNSAF